MSLARKILRHHMKTLPYPWAIALTWLPSLPYLVFKVEVALKNCTSFLLRCAMKDVLPRCKLRSPLWVPEFRGGYLFCTWKGRGPSILSFFRNKMMDNCIMHRGTLVENVCQVNQIHLANIQEFAWWVCPISGKFIQFAWQTSTMCVPSLIWNLKILYLDTICEECLYIILWNIMPYMWDSQLRMYLCLILYIYYW